MTTSAPSRLIDVLGVPSPEQARRVLLLLGLAGGGRNKNGVGVSAPTPSAENTRQQAS